MSNLTEFWYYGANNLSDLDLSQNKDLKEIHVTNNLLTTLDLSNNSNLAEIVLSDNKIAAIDLSENKKLKTLELKNNLLTSLDVSNNLLLDYATITWVNPMELTDIKQAKHHDIYNLN